MATLYRYNEPDNAFATCEEETVEPKNGTDFTLEELQGYVGGYIEIIHLNDGRIMVINEEGKLLGLPLNMLATIQYQLSYGPLDQIVGNALVCKNTEVL